MINFILSWNEVVKELDRLNKEFDKQLELEEIEFNGRWCDDGGRSVD